MSADLNFNEPPVDWGQLGFFFDGILIFNSPAFQKEPPILWKCDWTHIRNNDELAKALEEAEKPHLPEIEAAVAVLSLSVDPDLSGFSPEALGFLKIRAEACAAFLHMMSVESSTLFPPPKASWSQAIKWMLVDWWHKHGYVFTSDMHISDAFNNESGA